MDPAGADETARLIAAAGGRAEARAGDASRAADCEAFAAAAEEAFGALHILVSSIAVNDPSATVVELSEADWNRTLAVNLTGPFLLSKAALPRIVAAGGGSVILLASQFGRVGNARRPVYCASKGALIQLAKVMAIDHAAQNVRVNTLSPGAVETQRTTFRYGGPEQARAAIGPKYPIGRLGATEEIAEAALFLASDASSFMTGADLLVDGGYTAV
jgi:NAD(P)-dependent dehydrogenase (short-subunit alcohol dehydrogenase family)